MSLNQAKLHKLPVSILLFGRVGSNLEIRQRHRADLLPFAKIFDDFRQFLFCSRCHAASIRRTFEFGPQTEHQNALFVSFWSGSGSFWLTCSTSNATFAGVAERDFTLRVRMSHEERDMLWSLAEARGLTASDYIRQLVRATYEEQQGQKKKR